LDDTTREWIFRLLESNMKDMYVKVNKTFYNDADTGTLSLSTFVYRVLKRQNSQILVKDGCSFLKSSFASGFILNYR
jgi:hypothetical protein